MRFIPGYDWRAVETAPSARVTWASQSWDTRSVSVTRTMGGPMVSGWAGMIESSATVRMVAPDAQVEEDRLNLPHQSRLIPRKGQYMDVYLGDNRAQLRHLRGRILDVQAPSALEHVLEISLGDFCSRLDYPITVSAYGYRNPVTAVGDPDVRLALHTTGLVNRIFRDAGFYAVPEMVEGAALFVPLVGDAIPVRGNLVQSSLTEPGPEQVSPVHTVGPWGPAVMNLNHRYSITNTTGTMFVTGLMNIPSQPTGRPAVRMASTKGDLVIWLNQASISVTHPDSGETVGTVYTSEPGADGEQELRWAVWVGDNGGIVVQVGNSIQETLGTVPAVAGATWTHATIVTPARGGVQLAGVQVVPHPGTLSTRFRVPVAWDRTARIQSSAAHGVLLGRTSYVARNSLDLLKEIAQAERAAVWVDEDGVAWWRARSRLFNHPYTAITVDEAADLPWHGLWQDSRDRVEVLWKRPTLKLSKHSNVTVWSAKPSLGIGDLFEEFIGPGADEDWLRVDTNIQVLSYADSQLGRDSRRDARLSRGSRWTGVVQEIEAATNEDAGKFVAFANTADVSVSQLAPDRWRVYADALYGHNDDFRVNSSQELAFKVPSPDDFPLGSSSRSAAAQVVQSLHGEDGLVVRAGGVQSWHDESTIVGTQAGGGTVEHNAGHFITSQSEAEALAEFLNEFHATDRPVWEGVPVVPDVRRQVGDIVRVEVGTVQHRALILSINDDVQPGEWTQALTLQSIGEMV